MKGNCPRLTRLFALLLLAALTISPLTASATVVGNGNAFVPIENNQASGTGTNTGTTVTGGQANPNFVIPGGSGTTSAGTGTTGTGTTGTGQRNSSFLTPEEIAGTGAVAGTGTRNTSFLVAGETPYIPAVTNQRSQSFLVAGESPKDINGNPLAGPVGTNSFTTTKTGTRIGNCREWVNVRAKDNTKSEAVGKAYLNEAITVIRWNSVGSWAYISYNGGNGWVSGSFIKK